MERTIATAIVFIAWIAIVVAILPPLGHLHTVGSHPRQLGVYWTRMANTASGEFRDFTGGARRPGRSTSALARVLVLVAGISSLCAAPARAGVVTEPVPGTVSIRGLSTVARHTIKMMSMTVIGDQSLGPIVTVGFKGDVERYLAPLGRCRVHERVIFSGRDGRLVD